MTHTSRSRELLLGSLLIALVTVLGLGLGELGIRVISSQKLIYNIEMVKYATQLKMPDTLGQVSHVHRPNRSARLMGVDIALNHLGHRGSDLADPRPPSRKRVMVLGSSVTLGWGVPQESTFTARTEAVLNREHPFGPDYSFEFANAGIGNYNTVFQARLFERQYPLVRPDLVVLHYFISDVQPRTMGRNNAILKHSYLAAFLFDRWSLLKLSLSGSYRDLFSFYRELYQPESPAWLETQHQIQAMHDAAARDSVPFVLMIIPDVHDLSPTTPYKALYRQIDSTFESMGLQTVNTFDAYQQRYGDKVSQLWIQADDPHPNARGHAVMADELYRYLVTTDPLHLRVAGSR